MTGRVRCGACTLFHRSGRMGECNTIGSRFWPVQPLLDYLARSDPRPDGAPSPTGIVGKAARFGADVIQVHRYELSGIPESVADRWATRIGVHPVVIWGWGWVDAGLSVVDRQWLDGGWRQAWLADEAPQARSYASVTRSTPRMDPDTRTAHETRTTHHREIA